MPKVMTPEQAKRHMAHKLKMLTKSPRKRAKMAMGAMEQSPEGKAPASQKTMSLVTDAHIKAMDQVILQAGMAARRQRLGK